MPKYTVGTSVVISSQCRDPELCLLTGVVKSVVESPITTYFILLDIDGTTMPLEEHEITSLVADEE